MAHKPEFWDIYRVLVDFTEEDLHIQEAEKAVFSGKASAIPPDIPALFPPSHQ